MIERELPKEAPSRDPAARRGGTTLLGIPQLERFYDRVIAARHGTESDVDAATEWAADDTLMRCLGIDVAETTTYLILELPSFDDFERWIVAQNGGPYDPRHLANINASIDPDAGDAPSADVTADGLRVLDDEQLAFWDEHGYVVVRGAVERETARAAEDAVWAHLQMDRNDPTSWYGSPGVRLIWTKLRRDPALWAIRRAPRVRRAFEQLWNRTDLLVSLEEAGFVPPEPYAVPPPLHWDRSLVQPVRLGVHGLVYLHDVGPDDGAFTCVPGFHRRLGAWLAELPAGADPRAQDLHALGSVPIPGRAGDLVIWHQMLPHGNGANRGTRPRIVHYVKMLGPGSQAHRPWL